MAKKLIYNKASIVFFKKLKNTLHLNEKHNALIAIENLIIFLKNENSLKKMLIKYFLDENITIVNEADYKYALKTFNNLYDETIKFNPIMFKVHLFIPKLYEIDIQLLIIWIYKVELDENKLKTDNRKQFFYLIHKFQKEESDEIRIKILIELLSKIQLFIKNAK